MLVPRPDSPLCTEYRAPRNATSTENGWDIGQGLTWCWSRWLVRSEGVSLMSTLRLPIAEGDAGNNYWYGVANAGTEYETSKYG